MHEHGKLSQTELQRGSAQGEDSGRCQLQDVFVLSMLVGAGRAGGGWKECVQDASEQQVKNTQQRQEQEGSRG